MAKPIKFDQPRQARRRAALERFTLKPASQVADIAEYTARKEQERKALTERIGRQA